MKVIIPTLIDQNPVGLGIDDPVWMPTVFSKNRDRLLTTDITRQLLAAILEGKPVKPLLSDEHFSVGGTPGLR
jgi:hypothetical protein